MRLILKSLALSVLVPALLISVGAAPLHASVKIERPSGCWTRTATGFIPQLRLRVTPSEKLETLAVTAEFQATTRRNSAPAVYFDAEKNVHLSLNLSAGPGLPALPTAPTRVVVTARILPYADRNTTTLGQVRVVPLLSFELPNVVCKG